jgi:hypothetical protein
MGTDAHLFMCLHFRSGRTVLHVILEQLRDRDFAQLYPSLCEDCYRLIYELCANRRTHRPIFRFLNNREQGTDRTERLLRLPPLNSVPPSAHRLLL